MELQKDQTVTFTGYRSQEIQHLTEDKNLVNVITTEVYRTVKLFYEQGYNTFLTGGSEGFDLVAANAVLQLKRVNTDIQLVMVAPFIGQEQRYSAVDKMSYRYIWERADATVVLAEAYTDKGQYLRRNDYLVDNSTAMICYYDGLAGNTKYTHDRAQDAGHNSINICGMLYEYFANESLAKQAFQPYSRIQGFCYCKEGILIHRRDDEPLIIAFEQIAEVESKCGVLHIVMGNGLQLRASLLSNDCQVWFPGMDEPTVWESVSACYAQLKNRILPK